MLQYLINTTAIWLLSLLVFDIFLRRESFHGYNRAYLLGTLLLGALLPLWQWQDADVTPLTAGIKPVAQVIAAKQSIVAGASSPEAGTGSLPWLAIAYCVGVGIALLLLVIDVIKLVFLYRRGTSSVQHGWSIIETGKEHAPFSFRNTLFVNTIAQYSSEEWTMILQHERRHTALWHIADLMLLQLARIVFWFHPLVYIYQRRTLLVHEYQADSIAAQQPQAYGQFLVEQAILQSAPQITHSFNRSPIKKRILMLTRRSTTVSKIKVLLIMPVLAVCIICFSKNSFAQKFQRNGNVVTYRGNTFEYEPPSKADTQTMKDASGETIVRYITKNPIPIKFNGKKLCTTDDVTSRPEPKEKYRTIESHLLNGLSAEFAKLPDGGYWIDLTNVVLNDYGKVIYYEYNGFEANSKSPKVSADIAKAIAGKIDDLMMTAPQYVPAKINGKAVPVRTDVVTTEYKIEVTDHHPSFWMRTF